MSARVSGRRVWRVGPMRWTWSAWLSHFDCYDQPSAASHDCMSRPVTGTRHWTEAGARRALAAWERTVVGGGT